jgi:hypothetical protein
MRFTLLSAHGSPLSRLLAILGVLGVVVGGFAMISLNFWLGVTLGTIATGFLGIALYLLIENELLKVLCVALHRSDGVYFYWLYVFRRRFMLQSTTNQVIMHRGAMFMALSGAIIITKFRL